MQAMRKLFFADLHQAVRSEFDAVLREPLPQRCLDLIKELTKREAGDHPLVRCERLLTKATDDE